jgi:dihydrodipicolinate synthase/N-acetylneuraminate lyase
VPVDTEARIQALCAEAVAAEKESDVERIVGELRTTLTEHIKYAKASLEAQAAAIVAAESSYNTPSNQEP